MSTFANTLRVRPEVLRAPNAAGETPWTVRVQAELVLDAVRVVCAPESTVRAVKLVAMANLLPDVTEPDAFMVKLHGAEVTNEAVTLQAAGALDASTLFVTSRRRRPLR
jgi:hypothetical protein